MTLRLLSIRAGVMHQPGKDHRYVLFLHPPHDASPIQHAHPVTTKT
jgi:hypothetical protein